MQIFCLNTCNVKASIRNMVKWQTEEEKQNEFNQRFFLNS